MLTRSIVGVVLAGVLLSACGSSAQPTPPAGALETAVAQTLQAIPTPTAGGTGTTTPAPTPGPGGVPATGEGISLIVPGDLGATAAIEAIPEASGPDLPAWGIHPAHVQITLQGYPLQGTLLKPQIFVYPVAEFSQLSDSAAQTSAALKDVLGRQGALPPGPLPFLPPLNAAQVFYSNALNLPFESGTGIRFLTQFDQAPLPVNNNELIYTFQGLTTDGKYYVAAVLPVNAAFLPADSRQDSPTPPDGVPFSWTGMDAMPAYVEAVRQKLDATAPDAFTPSLTTLDTMMQSLRVEKP